MPSLQELIAQPNTTPPGSETSEPDAELDEWTILAPDWPPFDPPRALPPPPRLTIEWLWAVLWPGDGLYEADADELARTAAEWDAQFPGSHEALDRRAKPNWLAETLQFHRELTSARRWQRVEQLLNTVDPAGWHEVDRRRITWLRRHADAIRPVVEQAMASHVRCCGAGWLARGS